MNESAGKRNKVFFILSFLNSIRYLKGELNFLCLKKYEKRKKVLLWIKFTYCSSKLIRTQDSPHCAVYWMLHHCSNESNWKQNLVFILRAKKKIEQPVFCMWALTISSFPPFITKVGEKMQTMRARTREWKSRMKSLRDSIGYEYLIYIIFAYPL